MNQDLQGNSRGKMNPETLGTYILFLNYNSSGLRSNLLMGCIFF